jgi:hypothetical protein
MKIALVLTGVLAGLLAAAFDAEAGMKKGSGEEKSLATALAKKSAGPVMPAMGRRQEKETVPTTPTDTDTDTDTDVDVSTAPAQGTTPGGTTPGTSPGTRDMETDDTDTGTGRDIGY